MKKNRQNAGHCAPRRFVKIGRILSLCMALLLLSGCVKEPTESGALLSEPETVSIARYVDALNPRQQEACERLYEAVEVMDPDPIELGEGLDAGQVRQVLKAYYSDNPSQFWVVEGSQRVWLDKGAAYCSMTFLFNSVEARDKARYRMGQAVQQALRQVPQGASQFDRERILHDWLAGRCTYDYDAYNQVLDGGSIAGMEQSFTAFGALVGGKAACAGYARAMQVLLAAAGIDCGYLTGTGVDAKTGKTFAHAWNVVVIDGRKYHLDATWNDKDSWGVVNSQYQPMEGADAENLTAHGYFNLTDEAIARDHGGFAPQGCVSTEGFYFANLGVRMTRPDEAAQAAVTRELVRLGQSSGTLLEIYVGEADGKALYDSMTDGKDGFLFRCLKAANQELQRETFVTDKAAAWFDENTRVLFVSAFYQEE